MIDLIGCVIRSCRQSKEVETIADLVIGAPFGVRSLERKCTSLGTSAKDLLDFVRCARAILLEPVVWRPADSFPDLDPRTVARLMRVGHLDSNERASFPDFVRDQEFITDKRFIQELISRLS